MDNRVKSFRDLRIWQEGIELVKEVYKITVHFPRTELYGLTSQIRKAVVSIPSNIAEGHIRGHTAEFRQFLYIALGSLAELETQVVIAFELAFIDEKGSTSLITRMNTLGRQIRSLISKLTPNPQSLTPKKEER
ncbi:MAG: four helix bundle protein [Candidatus Stahlbacteria bacterium]|nr:four helix bundle protein [Candidatus Stahlbacteria bacterium]